MGQRPAKRHVIAEVRLTAGLSQAQLAKILGCARISIQKIEQGTLALSEELAAKAQKALDVSAGWLLANDPAQSAVTPRGNLWTKEFYELTQGTPPGHSWRVTFGVPMEDVKKLETSFTTLKAVQFGARIHRVLAGIKGRPKQGILLHRIEEAVEKWEEDFPSEDPSGKELNWYESEIEMARKEYEALSTRITESANEWIEGRPARARPKPKK